jgi:hypothetical protein
MPDKPPPEFLALAETKSTAFLERSLEFAKEQAKSGDRFAQDMVRWTEIVLRDRAKREDQLVLGKDGHTYTQRQYREKRERDNFQAGQGALTGNFASALVFKLTGDAHLAGLVGGLFSAVGGTAKGYNENKRITAPDPVPVSPPTGSPPPRDVEPQLRSEQSAAPAGEKSGTAGPNGLKAGGMELEWITWADLLSYAEAVFGLPDDVIAAARELTAAGVPPSQGSGDYLSLLAAAAGWRGTSNVSEPSDVAETGDPAAGSEDGTPDGADPIDSLDDALYPTSTSKDEQVDQAVDSDAEGRDDGGGAGGLTQPAQTSPRDDGFFDMEARPRGPEERDTTRLEVEPGTGPLSNETLEQGEAAAPQGSGGEESHAAEPTDQSYAPAPDELGSVSEKYSPASDELDVGGSAGERQCCQQEEDGQHSPASDELDVGTEGAGEQAEQVEYEQVEYEQVEYEQVEYEQVEYEQVQ